MLSGFAEADIHPAANPVKNVCLKIPQVQVNCAIHGAGGILDRLIRISPEPCFVLEASNPLGPGSWILHKISDSSCDCALEQSLKFMETKWKQYEIVTFIIILLSCLVTDLYQYIYAMTSLLKH